MNHRWVAALAGAVGLLHTSAAAGAPSLCRFAATGTAIQVTNLSLAAPPGEIALPASGRVVLAADGKRLYVSTGSEFAIVDVATLTRIGTIATPVRPSIYTVGPDGTLFAVQWLDDGPSVLALDPKSGSAGEPIRLSGLSAVYDIGVGDGGRLLFVLGSGREWHQVIRIVDLSGAIADVTAVVPVPAHQSIGMQVSPTGPFAYVPSVSLLSGEPGGTWLVPWSGDPVALGFAAGGSRALFSPDGGLAYVMQSSLPEGGPPTLVVDTATHAVVGELPGGAIAAFTDDGCVLIGAGRTLRRACPGDPHTPVVDRATLSPDAITPVRESGPTATAWTAGSCVPAEAPCEPGAPCLELLGARAGAGDTVEIEARLRSGGTEVVGLQADLYFDADLPLPFASPTAAGRRLPPCRVNPDIGKAASTFVCFESDERGCLTFRSLVLSLLDLEPIADGSDIFTCTLPIPTDATAGRYRLTCAHGGAANPNGEALPLRCTQGEVVVTAADESTHPLSRASRDTGCQVTPPHASAPLLAAPLLLLIIARRRR